MWIWVARIGVARIGVARIEVTDAAGVGSNRWAGVAMARA